MNNINPALCYKRKNKDIMKLKMSNYQVNVNPKDINSIKVKLNGPNNSPYEDGQWTVNVQLPKNYPYSSPSIGF